MGREVTYLEQVYDKVNKNSFQGAVNATIRVDVPGCTISNKSYNASYTIEKGSDEECAFSEGYELAKNQRFVQAAEKLIPLAKKGHEDSIEIVSLCIGEVRKQDEPTAIKLASKRNELLTTADTVPPSCASKDSSGNWVIRIHPALLEKSGRGLTPKYVFSYIIYHQMLRVFHDSPKNETESSPGTITKWDRIYPGRDKAIEWLGKYGYAIPS